MRGQTNEKHELKKFQKIKMNEAQKIRRQEKERERKRLWRLEHPEKARASDRKWADANRELKRARSRQYYAENRSDILAQCKRKRAADPRKARRNERVWNRNRAAKKSKPTARPSAQISLPLS